MVDLAAIKFNEGFIEGWIEQQVKEKRPGANRIFEAWQVYIRAFSDTRMSLSAAESQLASIKAAIS